MKKFFLFAVAIATLSLVSCGDGNGSSASNDSTAPNGNPESTTPSMNIESGAASVVSNPTSTPEEGTVENANDVTTTVEQQLDNAKNKGEAVINDAKIKQSKS